MKVEKYIRLYYRKLSGRISESERRVLEAAKLQPEERVVERSLQQIWEGSGHYGDDFEPDVEAGLQRLRQRMAQERRQVQEQEADTRLRTLVVRRRWLRLAAAVLLLLIAGWWAKDYFAPKPELQMVFTAAGEQEQIELPDGSVVVLNEKSRLAFPASFSREGRRDVRLSGEAFFTVTPDPGHPFVIQADAVTISVLGTSFNLRAYAEEDFAEVEVEEGRVRMEDTRGQSLEINPRERGFCTEAGVMDIIPAPDLNARAWQTGSLRFQNTPVPEVIRTLERHFNVRIELDSPDLTECTFDSHFETARLSDILETLELIFAAKVVQIEPGYYQLRSGQCR